MKIFKNARIKLTAWYLAIIMVISLIFSLVIYKGAEYELSHHAKRHQILVERFGNVIQDTELLTNADNEEIRHRVILTLIIANAVILIIAGRLGYFLAGKTLKPIKSMLDEQNRFIADASHELRTPLTAMRSSLEVNLRENLSPKVHKLLQIYLQEVINLQKLTDSLLHLARVHKPSPNFKFNNLSTQKIINEVCTNVEPLIKEKKIFLKKEILKDVTIYGHRKSLTNLFTTILDNAIKYNKKRGKSNTFKRHGNLTKR